MQIQYDIKPSEHLEMVKARRDPRRPRLFLSILGCCLAVISCWFIDLPFSVFLVLVFAALVLIEASLPTLVHRRVFYRIPRLFCVRTVTFDDEGIKSESDLGQIQRKWDSFETFKETDNLFLMFQTKDCVGIIPKRAFPTKVEMADFRRILTSKIGQH
jgi:YcxB-like protein